MTDTIDLDLVELRCKLRGWGYCYPPEEGGEAILVWPNNYTTAFFRAGEEWPRWAAQGRPQNEAWALALLAPRLTLYAILAAPGEGWSGSCAAETYVLAWSPAARAGLGGGDARVHVDETGRVAEPPRYPYGLTTTELIDAHLAAADLLVRLGEVTP